MPFLDGLEKPSWRKEGPDTWLNALDAERRTKDAKLDAPATADNKPVTTDNR